MSMFLIFSALISINTSVSYASYATNAIRGLERYRASYIPDIKFESTQQVSSGPYCSVSKIVASTPDPLNLLKRRLISWHQYNPKKTVKGNVIILPPRGGVNLVDRDQARLLCRYNLRAYLIDNITTGLQPDTALDVHNQAFLTGMSAIQHVSQLIDGDYAFIGTSLGGIYGSQLLTIEPRIKVAVLNVAGAPVIDVVVNSEQKDLKKIRDERTKIYGIKSRDEYFNLLLPHIDFDFITNFGLQHKPKVWFFTTRNDKSVPTYTQQNLIQILQPVKVTEFNVGHVEAVIKTFSYTRYIAKFILENMTDGEVSSK